MVAHGLAIALWLGSVALYGAAFFFPEVHRRHDFFWSGVAAFYGLVLWFDATQISSTELLGHGASLALLGWLGWQTLTLRRKRTPLDLQTPLTDESWPTFWANLKQSGLGFAKSTPLGRWLPADWQSPRGVDPAIAVAEIRASSLKDVDYEFVDELARPPVPESTPRAIAPKETNPAMPPQPRSPKPKSKQPVGRSQPAPPAPKPAASNSQSQPGKIAGLRNWLGNLVKARPSAKPSREVIEIPPRPSPLDRKRSEPRGSQQEAPKPKQGRSKREVIDIPPRPSPLDRKRPSAAAPPPQGTDTASAVTIVDTAVVDAATVENIDVETDGSEAIAPPSPPGDSPPAEPVAPTPPTPAPEPRPATSETNPETSVDNTWDDSDSNWIDD